VVQALKNDDKGAVVIAIDAAREAAAPPPVSHRVAGSYPIPTKQMQRILGPTAWTVWVYFVRNRDQAGQTHARNSRIVIDKKLTRRQVEHACRRLREAGLLQRVKWLDRHCKVKRKARVRVAVGDYRNGSVTVPKVCVRTLMRLTPHGGIRNGAGRTPKGAVFDRAKVAPKPLSRIAHELSCEEKYPETPNRVVGDSNQVVGDSHDQDVGHSASIVVSKVSKSLAQSGAADPSIIDHTRSSDHWIDHRSINDHGPRDAGQVCRTGGEESRSVKRTIVSPRKNTEEELTLIGQLIEPGGGIIPRFPDPDKDYRAVRLPSPPCIQKEASDLDAAWLLVKAYRGAVERILKEPCFMFANYKGAELQRSQFYEMLVEGSRTMRELEIPPASWVMFSFDAWNEVTKRGGKKRPAPINFVFGARRVRERSGWFARVETDYRNMRRIFAKEHMDYHRRLRGCYQLGLRALERVQKENAGYTDVELLRARLNAIVEQEFPGGNQAWLERARAAGEAHRATLAECLANGEFVWG